MYFNLAILSSNIRKLYLGQLGHKQDRSEGSNEPGEWTKEDQLEGCCLLLKVDEVERIKRSPFESKAL